MDIIRLSIGSKSGLNGLAIRKGQLIGVSDTKELYLDVDAITRMQLGYSTDSVDFLLSGKMSTDVYDPQNRAEDIFAATDANADAITAIQGDTTAIWIKLNNADTRSLNNATAITEIQNIIANFTDGNEVAF